MKNKILKLAKTLKSFFFNCSKSIFRNKEIAKKIITKKIKFGTNLISKKI